MIYLLRLLIVDDERLDREGLLKQLKWEDYSIYEVWTAWNGYEAIDMIKSHSPHILISDVKMPSMSGLQLAEKARELISDIKIIFISGYDDFELVKNAIKLDACEYILKPVDTPELAGAVEKVVRDIKRDIKTEEEKKDLIDTISESFPLLKRKLLEDIIYGTIREEEFWPKARKLDLKICDGSYSMLLAELDDIRLLKSSIQLEGFNIKLAAFHEMIEEIVAKTDFVEYLAINESSGAIILSYNQKMNNEVINGYAGETARTIVDEITKRMNLSLSIGVGHVVNSVSDLHSSYNSCCQAILGKIYRGKGKVLYCSDEAVCQHEDLKFENIDIELSKCILNYDLFRAYHLLDFMFEKLEFQRIYDERHIQNYCINIISRMQITILDLNEKIENIFGQGVILWDKLMKFETILDIRQWMKNIFAAVIEYMQNRNATVGAKIVEEAMSYVKEWYVKDITLKEIAEKLYYSPNYLGAIIKQVTGKGFSEYLAEYRIKKAAEFLEDPRLKVYEVADMVGYKAMHAFNKQFKIFYGITPGEYRERRK